MKIYFSIECIQAGSETVAHEPSPIPWRQDIIKPPLKWPLAPSSYIMTSAVAIGPSRPCTLMKEFFVSWWRHQMETFSALLAICAGTSPHKGQWRWALMFSLIGAWINGSVNNHEAGDLRRHRAHYDVIVMIIDTLHIEASSPSSLHSGTVNRGIDLAMHCKSNIPDSKFQGANMGPIWGRQDPGGPHVGPMYLAI